MRKKERKLSDTGVLKVRVFAYGVSLIPEWGMYNLMLQFHTLFLILYETELWLSKLFSVYIFIINLIITNVWLQSTFMPFSCSQVIDEAVCFTDYCHNYQIDSMSSKLQFQLRIFYYCLLQETSGECLELLCLTFQTCGSILLFCPLPFSYYYGQET